MAVNSKAIKSRIKSVGNTKKITKAMEMISAVKMRKATENVLATRSYSNLAWEMIADIGKKTNVDIHPLLKARSVRKMAVVLITSNRGLAGGFINKLLQEVDSYIKKEKELNENLEVDIVLMGKKGKRIFSYYKYNIEAEFEKLDLTTKIVEVLPMARMVVGDFINDKYDKIVLSYTDFQSAVKQNPRTKQLLPLTKIEDKELGSIDKVETEKNNDMYVDFTFEPDPKKVLNILLPKLVEMQVYQAVLESDASEHSARMMAMRNASDSAIDMIKELNLTYNKARQAAITQEISEIVSGAAALE